MAWRQEHPLRQQAQHQLHQHEHAISCQAVDQSILTERSSVHSVQTLTVAIKETHECLEFHHHVSTNHQTASTSQSPEWPHNDQKQVASPKILDVGLVQCTTSRQGFSSKKQEYFVTKWRERERSLKFSRLPSSSPHRCPKMWKKTKTHCGVWTYTNQPPCKASPSCVHQACVSRIDTDTTSAHQACPTTGLPPYFILPVTREGPASNHLPNARSMTHVPEGPISILHFALKGLLNRAEPFAHEGQQHATTVESGQPWVCCLLQRNVRFIRLLSRPEFAWCKKLTLE